MRPSGRALLALALPLGLACATATSERAPITIEAARADLAAGHFYFDSDVAFARDPYVVCVDLSCAELRVRDRRRTILLAPGAFASASRLRASLLDIWGRYENPGVPSPYQRAQSALRILEHGPKVGVTDRSLLRATHHRYGQLYLLLEPEKQAELPRPDDLAYP